MPPVCTSIHAVSADTALPNATLQVTHRPGCAPQTGAPFRAPQARLELYSAHGRGRGWLPCGWTWRPRAANLDASPDATARCQPAAPVAVASDDASGKLLRLAGDKSRHCAVSSLSCLIGTCAAPRPQLPPACHDVRRRIRRRSGQGKPGFARKHRQQPFCRSIAASPPTRLEHGVDTLASRQRFAMMDQNVLPAATRPHDTYR